MTETAADRRKSIATRLLSLAGQGEIAGVEALISDDFALEQMVRDPEGPANPGGTCHDRASYLGFLGAVGAMTRDGMNLAFDLVLCEGDDVAVFGTSDAHSPSGWHYRNAYCWHLRFRGEKVIRMREYFDTALGNRLLQG